MKLNEVDSTLNEGLSDVWAGIKATGASAVGAKETAQDILTKNNFVNNFVRKISTVLSTQWNTIVKNQEAKVRQQQQAQQQQAEKQQAMQTKAAPAQSAAPAQPSTIIDPKTGKPFTQQTTSESYNLFRRKFDKVLKEAEEAPAQEQYGMDNYILEMLPNYLQGVNLEPYMQNLTALAKQVEATYQSNHGIPALKQLGALIYDILKQHQAMQGMAPQKQVDSNVKSVLNTIKNMSPEDQQAVLAALQPAQK